MSFGDPSQQELRVMNGLEAPPEEVSPEDMAVVNPTVAVAHIAMSMPSANRVTTPPPAPGNEPFTENDVDMMRQALYSQGRFFMGRETSTKEACTKVARDLLWLLDIMLYQKPVPKQNGPLAPGPGFPWGGIN